MASVETVRSTPRPLPTGRASALPADDALTVAGFIERKLPDGATAKVRGFYAHAYSPSIEDHDFNMPLADLQAWSLDISDANDKSFPWARCNVPRNPGVAIGKTVTVEGTVLRGKNLYPCRVVAVE